MLEFEVEDMTCSHCAGTITNALKQAVPGASIDIDLPNHLIRVDGTDQAAAIASAIVQAGYTPVRKNGG